VQRLDVPVVSYHARTAAFMAARGFALGADGVWRDAAGRSYAAALAGKPAPRCWLRTWGCQMNEADSEALQGQLEQMGYGPAADAGEADLILLNTCAVRGTAAAHAMGEVGRLRQLKLQRPDVVLGVCGCLTQMPETIAYLQRHAPHVDLVFGTHNLHDLPALLQRAYVEEAQTVDVWGQAAETVEHLPARRLGGVRAWVNVIYGCDKYCTYCIVPTTRGRERSRRPGDVLAEVEALAAQGVREVTLLGQNVNSYGHDLGGYDFADLLRDVAKVPGIRWIRYTTSHPRDFTPRLVETIAATPKVCEHFHLPVQSGSDRVLRWMNRGYTRDAYLRLVATVRRLVPQATLTTDIIVGFPRETEEDFRETLSLVAEVGFDNAFTFAYSPRAGTPAARWEDPVPAEVKQERLERLNALQYAISRQHNEALVGQTLEVLIEGASPKDPGVFTARSRGNRLLLVPAVPGAEGHFGQARVLSAQTWTLRGDILSLEPVPAAALAARGA
jgi:tRNA-2-methylthio-N6-dimethylallyladenosine synthase